MNRCLMSAEAALAGLYPPAGDQLWKADLAWQPIPVHTVPIQYDHVSMHTSLRIQTTCTAGLEIHGGKVVNYHRNPQNYHQLLKLVVNIYHHILPRIYHSVSPP